MKLLMKRRDLWEVSFREIQEDCNDPSTDGAHYACLNVIRYDVIRNTDDVNKSLVWQTSTGVPL